MPQDTRDKNIRFSVENVQNYLTGYVSELTRGLFAVDQPGLRKATLAIKAARNMGCRFFVCGNGGSSAIAEHLVCDFQKGTHKPGRKNLRISSLTSNTPLLTAVSNDIGYDQAFSYQLALHGAQSFEILILISSSGNSPNILEALNYGIENKMITIGITGFDGGELAKRCDISLHVPVNNYGVAEDAAQALMHVLAQYDHLT